MTAPNMPAHTETVRLRLAPDDRLVLADLLESKGFDYLAEQLRVFTRKPVSWARCTIVAPPRRRNGAPTERDVWAARCPSDYMKGDVVEIRSRKGEITRVVLGDVIKQDPRGYTLRRWRKVRE